MGRIHVQTTVNGDETDFLCEADETLLDVLRDRLFLTGSKEGCGSGDCGACSVMVDNRLVCACLVLGPEAQGARIETIEGLAGGASSPGVNGGASSPGVNGRASSAGGNGGASGGLNEGANGSDLHPLQTAFIRHAALQCGICTPGILVAAKALLDKNPDPTEREVRYWLAGNLCRCTGYDKIIRAVLATAKELKDLREAA